LDPNETYEGVQVTYTGRIFIRYL